MFQAKALKITPCLLNIRRGFTCSIFILIWDDQASNSRKNKTQKIRFEIETDFF